MYELVSLELATPEPTFHVCRLVSPYEDREEAIRAARWHAKMDGWYFGVIDDEGCLIYSTNKGFGDVEVVR